MLLAVICLGIGIGTATTMFSVVDALLLQSPPFEDPRGLVLVQAFRRSHPLERSAASYPDFVDWKRRGERWVRLAAMRGATVQLRDGPESDTYPGLLATADLFTLLGIRPIMGRAFQDEDDEAGAAPVVLLSAALWRTRFGADPGIIGRSLLLNGQAHTVIGVMPDITHAAVPGVLRTARIWMPLAPVDSARRRDERSLVVVGRLEPTTAIRQAEDALRAISDDLAAQHAEDADWTAGLRPLGGDLAPSARSMLTLGTWAVVAVLLIACANAANLFSARLSGRKHEIAVRAALGASRGRIVRQLLIENAAVALLSALTGVVIAGWELDLLMRAMPPSAGAMSFRIDGAVLAFAAGLAVLASVGPALVPAIQASRGASIRDVLGDAGPAASRGKSSGRVRDAMVVGEVALSVVLLVSSLLLVQSLSNLLRADGTFDTSNLLAVRLELPENAHASPASTQRASDELLRSVGSLPGVQSAAVADFMPLRGGRGRGLVVPEGSDAPRESLATGSYSAVSARFFDTLNLPLMRGTDLGGDGADNTSRNVIVNETMADRLWAGGNAIGQRFHFADAMGGGTFTVVGVARDIANWDFSDRPRPTVYLPIENASHGELTLLIRSPSPLRVAETARRALQNVDPALRILDMAPMTEVQRSIFWRQETFAVTFAAFGVIATILAGVGMYGVLSYLVSLRAHEIGIRIALGAKRSDVAALILRRSLTLILLGIVLGAGGAFGFGRLMRRLLYQVSPADVPTVAGVAVCFLIVGMTASCSPAVRASNVDPTRLFSD